MGFSSSTATNTTNFSPQKWTNPKKSKVPHQPTRQKKPISHTMNLCVWWLKAHRAEQDRWAKKYHEIKREIGKHCRQIIKGRIKRSGMSSQGLMIQLSDKTMVTTVVDKWNEFMFGGSKVRAREKSQPTENFWALPKAYHMTYLTNWWLS